MSSMILSTAGNAAFGPIGGFLGALVGTAIDNAAITALTPARVQPSRLGSLRVQASQEGVPIPIVYGRFRLTGQVIWASKFNEINKKRTVGGKGGQRVVERSYSISFAIGLCEGPIQGIGKVWANGNQVDLSTLPHRLYLGGENQMPDPLIEAIEGLGHAPAYRGLAYIVFEDMPLGVYGDRIPQMSFEVMATAPAGPTGAPQLTDLARGICLIPGAGEFAYATTPIRKVLAAGYEVGENIHAQAGRADLDVALDQLGRDLPHVASVSLVVAWFGTDLRAGMCQILPKVEDATKQTSPRAWSVAGQSRSQAQVVSRAGGKPAYGGSPDDQSVIEAIAGLKARGLKVTHNPFVMMDIPAGNSLLSPHGGNTQPPYPWRGRISCYPGIGQAGSVDASAAATSQIAAFFGTASARHFAISGRNIAYSGPNEWSYRRFVLHQAALAKAAGGVDSFLIGSEMIGLTRVRDGAGGFPAVSALINLASEVRVMLGPDVKISYGADWTEYGAYAPPGTNDLRFPLDPLWASADVDYIGLDWYAPLTDRRAGESRLDLAALQAGIEGGEGFDFYYANEAARLSQTRTPITDGQYHEPWVWRQKDVRSFWSNAHFERFGGVRATTPTPWVPQSKPIALMELGFPAVDKGANRPSVFPDPKSSEAGVPPFSTGARDDVEQRLALEATLSYWAQHNPISPLYGGKMMDEARIHIWAWDARPYPYFPALLDVWADGAYAMLGHWLAGRAGALTLADLVGDICARGGLLNVDVSNISGYVDGFAIEAPTPARTILDNLFQVFGLEARQEGPTFAICDRPPPLPQAHIRPAHTLVQDQQIALTRTLAGGDNARGARFSCYAAEADYRPATDLTPHDGNQDEIINVSAPLVLAPGARAGIARSLGQIGDGYGLSGHLAPFLSTRVQVGDRIGLEDNSVWRIDRLEGGLAKRFLATRALKRHNISVAISPPLLPPPPVLAVAPELVVLDLPAPFVGQASTTALVGVGVKQWQGDVDVFLAEFDVATLKTSVTLGRLQSNHPIGPVGRVMHAPLDIALDFGAFVPKNGRAALLDGHHVLDVISWRQATLIGPSLWRLTGWVRGLGGAGQGGPLPAQTRFVVIDDAFVSVPLDPNLVGGAVDWTARLSTDTSRSTQAQVAFEGVALRPWSPCHVRAKRAGAGVAISWTRRARGTGDHWGPANAPLGAIQERYRIVILSAQNTPVRTFEALAPSLIYSNAHELADFGSAQATLRVEIAQIGDDERVGGVVRETCNV